MADPPRSPVADGSKLTPPKKFTHFALLEHSLGNVDPGFWTTTGVTRDLSLQTRLEDMIKVDGTIGELRLAIADLTSGSPRFAGNMNDKAVGNKGETIAPVARCLETWETVSTSKICVMYAAFQLRHDVLEFANANSSLTVAELKDKLRLKWLKSQVQDTTITPDVLRASGPKVEKRGQEILVDGKNLPLLAGHGAPNLDLIFDITKSGSTWTVDFKGEPANWHNDKTVLHRLQDNVKPAGEGYAFARPLPARGALDNRPLSFFEKLWLMIDASQNYATDDCLAAIGYLYINSLLWQAGLFDPRRGGGMWLGRNYGPNNSHLKWKPPPGPRLNTREGKAATIYAGMSAASGVAFMTLLHQNKLVNADACTKMKIFMQRHQIVDPKGASIDGSPAGFGIMRDRGDGKGDRLEVQRTYSKVGLGSFENYFDAALLVVKNKDTGLTHTYAVSFLDKHSKGWGPLANLNSPIYEVIDPP